LENSTRRDEYTRLISPVPSVEEMGEMETAVLDEDVADDVEVIKVLGHAVCEALIQGICEVRQPTPRSVCTVIAAILMTVQRCLGIDL